MIITGVTRHQCQLLVSEGRGILTDNESSSEDDSDNTTTMMTTMMTSMMTTIMPTMMTLMMTTMMTIIKMMIFRKCVCFFRLTNRRIMS